MGTASTFQADPGHIDYTPGSAVAVGDVVVRGSLFCVADRPIAANTQGALAIEGVFTLPKSTSVSVSQGDVVYWTGSAITTAANSGGQSPTAYDRAGFAAAAETQAATTVKVILNYG